MHSIFLHILIDILDFVMIVIFMLLMHFYSWLSFDLLIFFFIVVMIFASAVLLIISSVKTLLLIVSADVEYLLCNTLVGVSSLHNVITYFSLCFWVEDSGVPHNKLVSHEHELNDMLDWGKLRMLKMMHVVVTRAIDVKEVRVQTVQFLRKRNMNVMMQVKRE